MRSELITALRHDLDHSLFTVARLSGAGAWGAAGGAALFRGERIAALRALESREPATERERDSDTLAKLWILGYAQPAADVAVALPTLGLDGARELGLLAVDGDDAISTARPLVDLRPYAFVDSAGEASWWIASDLGELALPGALREDHVLGIGGASNTLSGLMIPRPVDRALDLGTGCGIQAMHAARHARHVVATDISERALEFARFNAELNLIDGIEFRLGSLFEPVAGERFDHIVSNPPFVITPRTEGVPSYEYRDGGMVGDELIATVVAGVADHLEPGGVAQLLGNWETGGRGKRGAWSVVDWVARGAAATVAGPASPPLDIWVVEREVQDITGYSETWIRDGGTRPGTPDFERLYAAWLDDFEARGISEIGFGYITLRRPQEPTARPVERIERLAGSLGAGAIGSSDIGLGPHIEHTLDALDRLRDLSDDDLLASTLLVAGDVTEQRHYWPGNDDPTVIELRQGGGFARTVASGTALSALVGACDGDLSVVAIVGALAQLLDVAEAELRAELVPRVRELVTVGILRLDSGEPVDS